MSHGVEAGEGLPRTKNTLHTRACMAQHGMEHWAGKAAIRSGIQPVREAFRDWRWAACSMTIAVKATTILVLQLVHARYERMDRVFVHVRSFKDIFVTRLEIKPHTSKPLMMMYRLQKCYSYMASPKAAQGNSDQLFCVATYNSSLYNSS